MASRTLKVEILGDANRFHRTMDQVERSTSRMATGFSRATSLIGIGFAALGGAAIVGGIRSLVDEAREAEKVGRQTAAVIKATGGVANVSAKDVDRLSTALSNQVGVDDELIASGANLLLTFKGVRNEVGAGNDVFNQAERAAVDMAAAMNDGEVTAQGLKSANIQLGKALNDPIKGISALTRVGVTFTQAQKDQIKALVEAGDVMGAQKIILKELGSEFGGAAKAASDPWQQLGVTLGNVKERIGTALLPALSSAATFITDDLIPAAERWWGKHGPEVRDSFSAIGQRIGNMIGRAREWWEEHGPAVQEAFLRAKDEAVKLGRELGDLRKDWDDNSKSVQGLIDTLKPLTDKVFPLVNWLAHRLATDEIGGKYGLIAQLGFLSKTFSFVFKRAVEEFRPLVLAILTGNHKIIASAATVAEAMHLPMAASLRKAEQKVGGFVRETNAWFNRLDDENVNVTGTARIDWGPFNKSEAAHRKQYPFHAGGVVPGSGTGDKVPAALEPGEVVWPNREADRRRLLQDPQVRSRLGFQRGGVTLGMRGLDATRSRLASFAGQVGPNLSGDVGGSLGGNLDRVLDAYGQRFAAAALKKFQAAGGGTGGSSAQAIKDFIRMVDRLPYIWGGVGPRGYDCSGLVGEIWNRVTGNKSYVRRWTTFTGLYDLGFKPLLSKWRRDQKSGRAAPSIYPGYGKPHAFTVGLSAHGPGSVGSSGHTAGNFLGLGFEAANPRAGIRIGGAAARPSSFQGFFYLPQADRKYLGAAQAFDRGGTLAPGLNLLANRTGRPEPLVPAGAAAPTITVNVIMAGAIVMGTEREVANRLEPAARAALKAALRREGKQLAEQL